MGEPFKFCSDQKSFVPKFKVCSVLGVYLCLFVSNFNRNVATCKVLFCFQECFVPNFNTNVYTYRVLFRIQKFGSVYRRVMLRISIQMCQLIEIFSEYKSFVPFIGDLCFNLSQHKCFNLFFRVPGLSLVGMSKLAAVTISCIVLFCLFFRNKPLGRTVCIIQS